MPARSAVQRRLGPIGRSVGPFSSAPALILRREEPTPGGIGFALFLLVNLVLFIRPGEIVDGLDDVPIYEVAICLCLAASLPLIFRQLTWRSLRVSPTTVFVLAILPAIMLSSIGHHLLWIGREQTISFLKVQAYFLLVVGLVNSIRRLRIFLGFIFVVMVLMAIVVLLGNFELIQVQSLSALSQHVQNMDTGVDDVVSRVRGLGIFNDPNDLSLIMVVGTIIGLHFLTESRNWGGRLMWALSVAPLLWVFELTRSRGGLLSLIAALGVFLTSRFGWRRALLLACLLGPLLILTLNARQTDIDLANHDDTAQGRMQLWRDSLVLFHHAPIFGIGAGELGQTYRMVSHNSFIQTFTELGLFGGTIFVGAMLLPILMSREMAKHLPPASGSDLKKWNFTILAIAVGYVVGMCSLTRSYTVPAYLPAALMGALSAIAMRRYPAFRTPLSLALVRRVCMVSAVCIMSFELCARFLVR